MAPALKNILPQSGSCTVTDPNQIWRYQLHFNKPSRMMTAKNALGSSVSIIPAFTEPGPNQSDWPDPMTGPNGAAWSIPGATITFSRYTDAAGVAGGFYDTWEWVIDYGPGNSAAAPGNPFVAYDETGTTTGVVGRPLGLQLNAPAVVPAPWVGYPGSASLGTYIEEAPKEIIKNSAEKVNWGLTIYSGELITPSGGPAAFPDCTGTYGCTNACTLVPIDTADSGFVDKIVAYMQPSYITTTVTIPGSPPTSANVRGLTAKGNTSTLAGMNEAKDQLEAAFLTDPKFNCDRVYGVVHVTDGLSGFCNPVNPGNSGNDADSLTFPPPATSPPFNGCSPFGNSPVGNPPCKKTGPNGNWIFPCEGRVGPYGCDTDSSGYDCLADTSANGGVGNTVYQSFPAGVAEEIWDLALTRPGRLLPPINPRTFVIGISEDVGKCELNYMAFRGRTDAAVADAGFNTAADPRLPVDNANNPTAWDPSLNYAFFASSSQALADSFEAIISATAVGDYSTGSPTSAAAAALDNVFILPSAEFPAWKGHVYAFDLTYAPGDPLYVMWDAGDVLSDSTKTGYVAPVDRKLYTWDPATQDLVALTAANLVQLQNLAGGGTALASFTANVLDFIRGNDGSLTDTGRAWRLGPVINSTPAFEVPPYQFAQNTVDDHTQFERDYEGRTPLLWVGSDDGFLHAFTLRDGEEKVAILPPNLLARQVELFNNFQAFAGGSTTVTVTGQPRNTDDHLYGIASSLRFSDVYDPNLSPPGYRTVGILTQGAGGKLMAGIDITNPSEGDAGYPVGSTQDPVEVLWTRFAPNDTWTVPALAPIIGIPPVGDSEWALISGGGLDPCSMVDLPSAPCTNTGGSSPFQLQPFIFVIDPLTGSVEQTHQPTNLASPSPWVGNQTFSDSVLTSQFQATFFPDNMAGIGVQADLNGQIWFIQPSSTPPADFADMILGINTADFLPAGFPAQQQPIYYGPAVNAFTTAGSGEKCLAFAWGSGSFYERSPRVSGSNIGTTGNFVPHLFIAANPATVPALAVTNPLSVASIAVKDTLPVIAGLTRERSQLVAAPVILTSLSGGISKALFLVYDPDEGCIGTSYIVQLLFDATACEIELSPPGHPILTTAVGAGAATGFVLSKGETFFSSSPAQVRNANVENTLAPPDNAFRPVWWKELK